MSSDVHYSPDDRSSSGVSGRECDLLGHPRRLHLFDVLEERDEPTLATVAGEIAARESDVPPADVPSGDRREVEITLVHDHLPRLSDHGVVDWDREEGTISIADDVPVPVADGSTLLRTWASVDGVDLETLAHPARVAILSVLDEGGPVRSLEEFAVDVASTLDGATANPDEVAIALHHSHLPAMATTDLLEYDPATKTISAPEETASFR